MEFRWIDWNIEHLGRHGVTPEEANEIVLRARQPYPKYMGDGRWLAWGATSTGKMLQVIFILDDDGTVFVIHARLLDEGEKRRLRRRMR
jgi:uncharacterized DUF497 family protein